MPPWTMTGSGARGGTKTILLSDEAETRRYVQQCLKKPENAPKRIGIYYREKDITGTWSDFREEILTSCKFSLEDKRG